MTLLVPKATYLAPKVKIVNPITTPSTKVQIDTKEADLSGFFEWFTAMTLTGNGGIEYYFNCSVFSLALEKVDVFTYELTWGTGKIKQLLNSMYKTMRFPGLTTSNKLTFSPDTLYVKKETHKIVVGIDNVFCVECRENNSWFCCVEDKKNSFKVEFIHRIDNCRPLRYNHNESLVLVQRNQTSGYNCTGTVTGTLSFKGKTIKVLENGFLLCRTDNF